MIKRRIPVDTNKVRKTRNRGQTMVEFALVFPLFLLLLVGIFEFTRLMAIFAGSAQAAREAARYGAGAGFNEAGLEHYLDCPGILANAQRVSILAPVSADNLVVQFDDGPNGTRGIFGDCSGNLPGASEFQLGDRVVVSLTVQFRPLILLNNIPPLELFSKSARMILKEVYIAGATATPSVTGGPSSTPTLSPTPTSTKTLTPTRTNTPTSTRTITPGGPTLTNSPTASKTPTPTKTRTPTPTIPLPAPPIYLSVDWVRQANKCRIYSITWTSNPSWSTNPGANPVNYQLNHDGGTWIVAFTTPATWVDETLTILNHQQQATYQVVAMFTGPIGSNPLIKIFTCVNGNLVVVQ